MIALLSCLLGSACSGDTATLQDLPDPVTLPAGRFLAGHVDVGVELSDTPILSADFVVDRQRGLVWSHATSDESLGGVDCEIVSNQVSTTQRCNGDAIEPASAAAVTDVVFPTISWIDTDDVDAGLDMLLAAAPGPLDPLADGTFRAAIAEECPSDRDGDGFSDETICTIALGLDPSGTHLESMRVENPSANLYSAWFRVESLHAVATMPPSADELLGQME